MYDYVVKELPKVLSENFKQLDMSRVSISGHSMGGHGALTIYLKNLDKYKVLVELIFLLKKCNCMLQNILSESLTNNCSYILHDFQSVSAFAPITNPMNCPWGQKAFSNYLGSNKSDWEVSFP